MGFRDSAKHVTLTQAQLEQLVDAVSTATAEKLLAGLRAEGRLLPAPGSTLTVGPLVVDLDGLEARLDGKPLALQLVQFRVLAVLAKHVGQVLTRDQITEMAYDDPTSPHVQSVDVAIHRLRLAFGERAGMLHTVVRVGYKLVADPATPPGRRWKTRR
ncbi:MAG: winged helix-turn-helix domain-containing protein [Candidatus Velthaea sp.]